MNVINNRIQALAQDADSYGSRYTCMDNDQNEDLDPIFSRAHYRTPASQRAI